MWWSGSFSQSGLERRSLLIPPPREGGRLQTGWKSFQGWEATTGLNIWLDKCQQGSRTKDSVVLKLNRNGIKSVYISSVCYSFLTVLSKSVFKAWINIPAVNVNFYFEVLYRAWLFSFILAKNAVTSWTRSLTSMQYCHYSFGASVCYQNQVKLQDAVFLCVT